jgi:hypothetical protein
MFCPATFQSGYQLTARSRHLPAGWETRQEPGDGEQIRASARAQIAADQGIVEVHHPLNEMNETHAAQGTQTPGLGLHESQAAKTAARDQVGVGIGGQKFKQRGMQRHSRAAAVSVEGRQRPPADSSEARGSLAAGAGQAVKAELVLTGGGRFVHRPQVLFDQVRRNLCHFVAHRLAGNLLGTSV